jgi:uncharacterized membrane protein YkoI
MKSVALLAALIVGGLLIPAADAQTLPAAQRETSLQRSTSEQDAIISPRQAASIARERYGGRVLSVHLPEPGNVYHVKLLKDGEIRVVTVPAR